MKIHNLTKEEVLRTLVTSENGISEDEAKRRLNEFGLNEIKEVKKKPLYLRFFGQFTHFLAILLWIASFMSFLSEYLHPGEGMLTLGLAIVAVILINAVFTFIQEYRAEKALEELKKLLPFYVKVLRDGREKEIHAKEVVPGDIIILSEGDKIPADARMIITAELKVNNASLTGESEPMLRSSNVFSGEFIESPNIIFAGTTVISGSGKAVAFATGMSTEFGRIAHLTGAVETGLSPLQKEIIRATRVIAVIAMTTGIFFFAVGMLTGRSFWHNLLFAIGITIANVPEGLLPTVTLALAMGSQRMARKKALIKTLTSVETLGAVTVICTDKTGTLTQNKMAATKLWFDEKVTNADGLKKEDASLLLKTAYLCNNARFIDGQYRGDPTEVALLKIARGKIGDIQADRMFEIPFDSERKRMTTIHRMQDAGCTIHPPLSPLNNGGIKEGFHESCIMDHASFVAYTKGALESVLPLCSHALINEEKTSIDEKLKEEITNGYHSLMDKGLRVLAFAYKEIEESEKLKVKSEKLEDTAIRNLQSAIELDLTFVGLIGLEDPPRPEVPEAIKKCNDAGIKIIMITGDASRTAVAIAREIGLIKGNPIIIEGSEFNRLNDKELREKLSEKEIIFSRMTPKHKMRVVSILKEEGEVVAVTGDGVNDAPALKKADIGIAMGISGTDVAKEASDLILLDDNFATIVNAVEEGRTIFENIRKFITYIFAHLTPEAIPYILFSIFRIPLPITVLQILAIDLGTETIPALGLGADSPEPNIMKNPPRAKTSRLIDKALLFRGYIFLGLIGTVGVLFAYFFVLSNGGWKWGTELPVNASLVHQASAATFLGIVIMQIGNVFACRTQTESVFKIGFFGNRLILWGILIEILLSIFIIYHPWGNKIFSTAPLSLSVWLLLIPFALLVFFAEEMRKFFIRKKDFHKINQPVVSPQ
jgi:sodium/potassium-transporting ATPase subunit alpha